MSGSVSYTLINENSGITELLNPESNEEHIIIDLARLAAFIATPSGSGNLLLDQSPVLKGTPTTSTPEINDNSERVVNTSWATAKFALAAHSHSADNITSGTLPVSRGGTGTTSTTGSGSVVYSVSPALTGTPTVPTVGVADNSTKIANSSFVQTAIASGKSADSGLWNGSNKTVSTAAPSGGNNGDFWFQYA